MGCSRSTALLFCFFMIMHLIFAVTTTVVALVSPSWALAPANITAVCQEIAQQVSNASAVFYPGSSEYAADIFHDSASSSTQESVCSVEAGTARDVGLILQLVGSTRTPFAGGGHAWNPGFSSTTGVQIAMSRFNTVIYSKTSQYGKDAPNGTVTFGAGLLWNDIYAALDPFNITVVGGRVVGVGAAGFLLGGGYSFFSNQYGMAVDNILAFDIVKPDGTESTVTASSDPDLFWALKGGLNNFGIVTAFTMRAIPYTRVWGALVAHVNQAEAYKSAFEVFNATSKDPKAAMLFGLNGIGGQAIQFAVMFYDGPEQPAGIYDAFLDIPGALVNNNGTFTMSEFLAAVNVAGLEGTGGGPQPRGQSGIIHIETYTPELVDVVINEVSLNIPLLANVSGGFTYTVEPFSPGYLTAPLLPRTSDSAFPPTWTRAYSASVCNAVFEWPDATGDAAGLAALQASVQRIQAAETAQSGRTLPRYSNLALADTPLVELFGAVNLARLTEIAERVDPGRVMRLAGGFKV
ncbi:FAD-binding domain-containing protein [Mycena galericulata]|nr:FAD-binding domain-containing protein [Mycena galericulata]